MSTTLFVKIVIFGLMSLTSTLALGPAAVNLGTAANFVILAESGVSTVPASVITGNVAVSPLSRTALTGFAATASADGTFETSAQVTGELFAADFTSPTPSILTTAVADMLTAFNDAFGRLNPTAVGLGGGSIGGLTFAPGLYKWASPVNIATHITVSGGVSDVWIFQVSGTLTLGNSKKIILAGGALAQNIFWVASDVVSVGSAATFNGVLLCGTSATIHTGATVNGRILAQTAVTLQKAIVTGPA